MNANLVYTAMLAMLLTPVISFLKQEHWPQAAKYLVAVAVSALAAVVEVVIQNKPTTWTQFGALLGVAIATTQTIYNIYFAGSSLENLLRRMPQRPAVNTNTVEDANATDKNKKGATP